MKREQKEQIIADLEKKIVFLVGPRQVGKTWLAKDIATGFKNPVYLNYDSSGDRKIIRGEKWPGATELLILDELHKMSGWKGFLKGVYDTRRPGLRILVTGSARLDTFRKGGDSLAGRFFSHKLLPFSPSELRDTAYAEQPGLFIERGGFPEPFLAEKPEDAARWRLEYTDGLIREDILDFERISDLRTIRLVLDLLRERVGSPVSYTSIAEDAQVSVNTVRKYVGILEALFVIFRVQPFTRNIARSLLKSPKIYFFDTGLVRGDAGAAFENLAAVCLLKYVSLRTDSEGVEHCLHYLRTKEGREVDFCITRDGKPRLLIEAKYSDSDPANSLLYFSDRLGLPAVQVVMDLKREWRERNAEILSAAKYLKGLNGPLEFLSATPKQQAAI